MGPIQKAGTVAVTGASGFVGGWIVRRLLDGGYRVRACVRDPADTEKVGFLAALPGFASGRLTLHAADLDQPGCFDEVFVGCHGVCHVSHLSDYTDAETVQRACDHVAASVSASRTVRRVVVTSSMATVMIESDIQEFVRRPVIFEDRTLGPGIDDTGGFLEAYAAAKGSVERSFAEAAEDDGSWDAITCCPGDNLGPILSAHHAKRGPWQSIVGGMLRGKCYQNQDYRPLMSVDVRDDAECHVRLLESVHVSNGDRFMACSGESVDLVDICHRIDRLLPELELDAPEIIDRHPDEIRAREAEYRAIWAGCEVRNDRIRMATDIEFRAFDDTLRDCVESLITIGGIEPKRRGGSQP